MPRKGVPSCVKNTKENSLRVRGVKIFTLLQAVLRTGNHLKQYKMNGCDKATHSAEESSSAFSQFDMRNIVILKSVNCL